MVADAPSAKINGDIENQKSMPKLFKLSACVAEPHVFCFECFRDAFHSLIEQQQRHEDLKCLQHGCESRATSAEVQLICEDRVFKKYKHFCDNTRVMNDKKNLMFCIDPKCDQVIDRRDFQKQNYM